VLGGPLATIPQPIDELLYGNQHGFRANTDGLPRDAPSRYNPDVVSQPYRSRRDKPRERLEPKDGLVMDMVRQFADPYAFLRELVQNSMDAGATRIEVTLLRSSEGMVQTSVRDDGTGMTPPIMENALLTLFSSSKEGDSTKIGKYGVGFISVLALDPERVLVDTWRDGGAWRAVIQRDQSWVIEESTARPSNGTTVTLESAMDAEAFDAHVANARASLSRWCRHANVAIHFSSTDYSMPGTAKRTRIDEPLAVPAVASVVAVDGNDTIVVGPAAGAEAVQRPDGEARAPVPTRFVGFYNRGLTLYETSTEIFPGLDGFFAKISSPDLKHTLSRDNVRREGRFDELLGKARRLAQRALPKAIEESLKDRALAVAHGEDPALHVALLVAAGSRELALDAKAVWFPLTNAVGDDEVLSAHALGKQTPRGEPILTATEADPLTAALATHGRPVVKVSAAEVAVLLASYHLNRRPRSVEAAHLRHVLVSEIAQSDLADSDRELADRVVRLLGRVGTPAAGIEFARTLGARTGAAVIAKERIAGVISTEEAKEAAGAWNGRSTLLLDTREEAVRLARERARSEPRAAAHLLARILLLDRDGAASRGTNQALLADFAGEAS
jgi:molecular chaperone HtpG